MYASAQAREQGIAANVALPASELRAAISSAPARFTAAVGAMTPQAWNVRVRTAQGRIVPALDVPWMRCREVWVHTVDLDADAGFANVPHDVLTSLIDDVVATWDRRDQRPDIRLSGGGRTWINGRTPVESDLPLLAAYVTGRRRTESAPAGGSLPDLPGWL